MVPSGPGCLFKRDEKGGGLIFFPVCGFIKTRGLFLAEIINFSTDFTFKKEKENLHFFLPCVSTF